MASLASLARSIDRFSEITGRGVAWLALTIVLTQFVVVLLRYVFGVGSVLVQESIVYMHAALFLVAAGYTLLHNGHVRCDLFYDKASAKGQAWIDLLGVVLFLAPMCLVIAWVSWPYVANSWAVLEGSPEGDSGIPGVFLLKTLIPLFALSTLLQGLAMAVHALLVVLGPPSPASNETAAGR